MRRYLLPAALLAVVLVTASCTPGPNTAAAGGGDSAGFLQGLWHGFIVLFTFVLSLFRNDVSMYEVANNGAWYDFGFILGAMCFFGGGGGGAACGGKKCG
ncbi:MAG: hypothetical protein GY838_17330 [bacterium]|nr:hypothetical protein [bacterium]